MNPKYALFIWTSYALTAAVVIWNLLAPRLRRNQLQRRMSDGEDSETIGNDE